MISAHIADLLSSGARSYRASATPSLKEGEWNTLFECEGPGLINHIWITFPWKDQMLGRRNLLRMVWDEEEDPSVEAPLTDFFGFPFGFTGTEYGLASHYLVAAPRNGFNCYFPMPFAHKARIEIFPEQLEDGGGFYIQVDHYRFAEDLPEEWKELRFHAQFRFENPCENYGRNYLFLDAEGEGTLAGVTFGVEANEPQLDAWVHGGGDSIFIDGEAHPHTLHGIGAEDFVGHSWGVQEFQSPRIGTPLLQTCEGTGFHRTVIYRFFVDDPIPFRRSIRCVLGAMANRYSSVAYWYQKEPHRRFFATPSADLRMPDSEAPYGTFDLDPQTERWLLLAPIRITDKNPFDEVLPLEISETGEESLLFEPHGTPTRSGGERMEVQWVAQETYHTFVDFHAIARPAVRNISLQTGVAGYALRYIESAEDREINAHIGFDDDVSVRVNDDLAYRGSHPTGFESATFKVHLKEGRNRILVKLSNHANTTWRLWSFSFRLGD